MFSLRPAGLPSHPQHALAKQLLTNGFCGVFSCYINGSAEQTKVFLKKLKVIQAKAILTNRMHAPSIGRLTTLTDVLDGTVD